MGLFSSFYTDRGSHYFFTPKAGEKVSRNELTQVGRALQDLGIRHIASYSPQGRGRMERVWKPCRAGCRRSRAFRRSPPSRRSTASSPKLTSNEVRQYDDGALAIFHGPRRPADYVADGTLITRETKHQSAA